MNPFRDAPVHVDRGRYDIVLKRLPLGLRGHALDIGERNPFTPLLACRYGDLKVLNTDSGIDFDSDKFHWSDSGFDVIFHFEVIEHLMNPLFHLWECHRILTSTGRMFLTTPKAWHPPFLWNRAHFLGFDAYRLRILLARAGFSIVRFERLRNRNLFSYLQVGFFRALFRWLYGSTIGGWWFVELKKGDS